MSELPSLMRKTPFADKDQEQGASRSRGTRRLGKIDSIPR